MGGPNVRIRLYVHSSHFETRKRPRKLQVNDPAQCPLRSRKRPWRRRSHSRPRENFPCEVSVNYMGMRTCFWADACKSGCAGSCGGPEILGISTAEVAPDGSFKLELPDFSGDLIVSDSLGELDFWLGGVKGAPYLVPESPASNTFKVAASYPGEVIFVPLDFKNAHRQSH